MNRTRRTLRSFFTVLGVASCVIALERHASAQEPERESAAMEANRGFHLGLGPTILLPNDDGPLGGGLTIDGRYGIKAGPTVIAPGARASGYIISSRLIGMPMVTGRVTLPVGPLAPYVVGGVGPGFVSNPSETGAAVLGGGGLMIHFGHVVAVGAEATYQTITSTEFKSVALGPSIMFGG